MVAFETALLILTQYGLVGLFAGSFALSLIFFPGLVEAIIPVFLALQFNPYLVFIVALAGSAAGGVVNYMFGHFWSKAIKEKYWKRLRMNRAEKWLDKYGTFSIFVASFIPAFPFDVLAVAVGLLHMDFKPFFISMLLGKAVKIAMIVFGFQAFIHLAQYFHFL